MLEGLREALNYVVDLGKKGRGAEGVGNLRKDLCNQGTGPLWEM